MGIPISMEQHMKEFMADVKEFHPFAAYDGSLDEVFVLLKDCSCVEKRTKYGMIDVLENNHPEEGEHPFAGLIISGLRRFAKAKNRADLSGDQSIVSILKIIFEHMPSPDLQDLLGSNGKEIIEILKKENLSVQLPA